MGKSLIAIAASAGLLLAIVASAEAGGRPSGTPRTQGAAFNPPGLTNLPSAATNNGHFTTGSTISAPTAWSTKTDNPGWNASMVPPGLGTVPPNH